MKYRLYTTSTRAWDAMLSAIRSAHVSIYLEMFIFLDDTGAEHDFIGALCERAQAGVRVVLVIDASGSAALSQRTINLLREAGVEMRFFSHWLRHIHRKILIVDESVAFLGGVNIGRAFATWHDLQLRLRGRIVSQLLASFAYTYGISGGQNSHILAFRERVFSRRLRSWLVEHWPLHNIYSLKDHYIQHISEAQTSISIATPYLTPPRWLLSLLEAAVHRGVRVEIFFPRKTDHGFFVNRVNYHYAHVLERLGVNLLMLPEMNHAKLLLIDGKQGLLGSNNMDILSFQVNAEIGFFFQNKRLIGELERVITTWRSQATVFVPAHYHHRLTDYLVWALSKILYPIL